MRAWLYLIAAAVAGAVVTTPALLVLVFAGGSVDDALFAAFATLLLVSGLAVVTMRDIIRCGLAMIVAFLALAAIYVVVGAPLVAAAQVIVYIGAISVLILFAIMLTQSKAGPARLVFQTQAVPAAIAAIVLVGPHRPRARGDGLGRGRPAGQARDGHPRARPVRRVRAPVRARQRPPPRGGDRRRLHRQARGGARLMGLADSLDAYLILAGALFAIGSFGFLARRNAISMLMSIELMLNAVNLAIVAFGAFIPGLKADGSVIALMVMAVAAAEATVGLAIVIAIYRNRKTPLVNEYDAMRR